MDDFVSPCGTFRVEYQGSEWAASQWVFNARVYHAPTGALLNEFTDRTDVFASSDGPGRLLLALRTYPNGADVTKLILDANDGTTNFEDGGVMKKVINPELRAVYPPLRPYVPE